MLQALFRKQKPPVQMDLLTYDIWLRALWAIPTVLQEIDLDEMRHETLSHGSNDDIRLVASLIQLKREDHQPS